MNTHEELPVREEIAADAGDCDREQRSATDSLEVTGVLDPIDQD